MGPSTDSCGTPLVNSDQELKVELIFVLWKRFLR